ncbi:nicotinate-nucleotide--dimethylbenzimidazole phosphoribosyltransferase [Desulfopila sp. IMCC35006]|uniref:nicotinate-nucleotide--dimethylbenzimidazole phosphoribosyltransferase n=1 Tax=Desulfopila sp. IMCC35006 TaxID=2569542 RepID=UPI0010AD103C|nr:nicotinate-nucleotide--dimethylbenzimidazole phosphoribosyltransferase [Desulfopila sp. IMCC35006]TKB26221.1 nicotinate-nucleotide--dimethylbenzimidazole phosphoribosyltransferase [Desulfopila sp. IMCC35006]
MKLILTRCEALACIDDCEPPAAHDGNIVLTVSCCAVCRTDAKMWRQGHRDLVLPRVLGHEIAGRDPQSGKLYTVWPGQACGLCRYCLSGRENLCDAMRILGFHTDGGFARAVSVPHKSLIAVEEDIEPLILTFAEPVACVLNGLSNSALAANQRVILYGGGVMGMIAALICREQQCRVTVIERSQEKIDRLRPFCAKNSIELAKDTVAADFDLAINCCADPAALSLCIAKLCKGGRLVFFSGLTKNEDIETNLLNLIHYKELEIYGAYGPRREHMVQALPFCARQQKNLAMLIEKVISPEEVEAVLPQILAGNSLKYIVDFTGMGKHAEMDSSTGAGSETRPKRAVVLSDFLGQLVAGIKPVAESLKSQARKKVDLKTKPLGALGRIEEIAVQVSAARQSLNPTIACKRMFVFAGDHGVVEEGVSAFPARVTLQMIDNFLNGGAAINSFCRHYGIELAVVDMGVNGELRDHPMLIKQKVAPGTCNFTLRRAMRPDEAIRAIENGARMFLEKNERQPCDLVGMGEMGIGNTSSAAAIICGATGLAPAQVVGRGTGVDDRGLMRKREVLEKALALHRPPKDNGLELLSMLGGFELGGICGAVLAAASTGCVVVLDGLISTAAGLLAYLLCPEVKDYLIAGHKSVEVGQQAALDIMGLTPVVDLDMRLGEGTGAAVTMNLVELSCCMMRDMASFEEAGVDRHMVAVRCHR